jgi:hypothetical protein
MAELTQEPQGIGFFSVKSGETHYAKLEPTIAAYINSSDMGINASRGQDFGWRLDPEWVKRVRAFRRDNMQMQILTQRNDGQKPTTVQILYFLYGEDMRAYAEELEEHENPYEEEYLGKISTKSDPVKPKADTEKLTQPEADEELVDEVDVDAAAEAATSDPEPAKPKATPRKK